MAKGFVCLTAVIDVAGRRALAWRVAITLEAGQAHTAIDRLLNWYNESRPHSSLGKQTPKEAYAAMLPAVKLAA
jgi:transposase InsO family protein